MNKFPCKRCGIKTSSETIKCTVGLCLPCFENSSKSPLDKIIERIAKIAGIRTDSWHTDLPNTKQIEELDAQSEPPQQCECCEYLTLSKKGIGERCGVCAWVDQTDSSCNLNDGLSLNEGKKNYSKNDVCDDKYFMKTRCVRLKEMIPSEEEFEEPELAQVEETTEEKEILVSGIYERIMSSLHQSECISEGERSIHDVYCITVEAGSGVSFEQYFRWADRSSVIDVVRRIRLLEMDEVANIVQAAIDTAFPDGYPADDSAIEEAKDWSNNQLSELEKLYYQFDSYHGLITNRLAEYAVKLSIR